jgi:hypothetical protein
LGDCLLWAITSKITKVSKILGYFFRGALILSEKALGNILGEFFENSSTTYEFTATYNASVVVG